jgi:uncharacterized protein (DUF1330 family)
MDQRITIGIAMLAGATLGAAGVQTIHAQAKPPIYYVAEIDVSNPEAYAAEYAPKAQAIIKAHGGRLVAIGGTAGTGATKLTAFDGDPPKRAVVQVWDSMEKVQAWRNDPEYKALREIGNKYAKFRSYAIEGLAPPASQ